ncbi:hypothetical protein AF332_11580 [Sporosarcina globispora]|uniref:Uncharacterized protein n=1 Tax=Sporosarcina globispora TaxID=1459 RepID=A0A0M0GCA9_SPOGL|nr:hypothetical protein [Sporosarcina globispora]KON87403.1 hypothetical protein AF332_11580 [Sporosarcina globispora]
MESLFKEESIIKSKTKKVDSKVILQFKSLGLDFHPDTFEHFRGNDSIYLDALREIDTHIRATKDPVPFIIDTLKKTLPEYNDQHTNRL